MGLVSTRRLEGYEDLAARVLLNLEISYYLGVFALMGCFGCLFY